MLQLHLRTVYFTDPGPKQKPHLGNNLSNSPLCNSSPRVCTVVPENITKRYFGSSELQCVCVCVTPKKWTYAGMLLKQTHKHMDSKQRWVAEREGEVQLRALLHLVNQQNSRRWSENKMSQCCKNPSNTSWNDQNPPWSKTGTNLIQRDNESDYNLSQDSIRVVLVAHIFSKNTRLPCNA